MAKCIVRFRQNGDPKLIAVGLTLEEAQAHCNDETTHGPGGYDGYDDEAAWPELISRESENYSVRLYEPMEER